MSKLIYELKDMKAFGALEPRPSEWTAIIPAAGMGTRLGYARPKILYPILDRPLAHWLIDILGPACQRMVFVASPSGRDAIAAEVGTVLDRSRYDVVVQPTPIGMADAIWKAERFIRTPQVVVVWGDQVTLRPETLRSGMRIHTRTPVTRATIPTIMKKNPYIHFERDPEGRIRRVLQAREGDLMPEFGENDSGLFMFQASALFSQTMKINPERGRSTGEFNFLPLIPRLDEAEGNVVTARIISEEETLGVNTRDEAALAERTLRRATFRKAANE